MELFILEQISSYELEELHQTIELEELHRTKFLP